MKRTVLACIALLFLASLQMSAQQAGGEGGKCHYEGSVSLTYQSLISFGIETAHGVRFSESGLFIGGMAGFSSGLPLGTAYYGGILPRWYFLDSGKVGMFLSCGLLYSHYNNVWHGSQYPPDEYPDKNYRGGMSVMPELGLGFKLNNGNSIFLAVRGFVSFTFYDSWWYCGDDRFTDRRDRTYIYPSVGIGYRF